MSIQFNQGDFIRWSDGAETSDAHQVQTQDGIAVNLAFRSSGGYQYRDQFNSEHIADWSADPKGIFCVEFESDDVAIIYIDQTQVYEPGASDDAPQRVDKNFYYRVSDRESFLKSMKDNGLGVFENIDSDQTCIVNPNEISSISVNPDGTCFIDGRYLGDGFLVKATIEDMVQAYGESFCADKITFSFDNNGIAEKLRLGDTSPRALIDNYLGLLEELGGMETQALAEQDVRIEELRAQLADAERGREQIVSDAARLREGLEAANTSARSALRLEEPN